MRNPLSKVITEIQPSGIRKFFDIVTEMKDAISLGVGEPDFDTPWHVRDEGIYSMEKGRTLSPCMLNSRKSSKRRLGEAAEKAGSMKSRQNCPGCSETAG